MCSQWVVLAFNIQYCIPSLRIIINIKVSIMAQYGYARVSSLSQSTEIQVDALKQAGCTVVREEK